MDNKQIGQVKFKPVRPFNYSKPHQLQLQKLGHYFGPQKWYNYKSFGEYNIHTIAMNLHYKACHSPARVQLRWRPAWLKFAKQHKL